MIDFYVYLCFLNETLNLCLFSLYIFLKISITVDNYLKNEFYSLFNVVIESTRCS